MPSLKPAMRASILLRLSAASLGATLIVWAIGSWTADQPYWWLSAVFTVLIAVGFVGLLYLWVVKPACLRAAETGRSGEHDAITQTLNRHGVTVKLFELMALADRYGNRLSVALVGVDHLQDLVDEFGENVRDSILRSITEVLTDTIRMPDRIGRYDADQFLAILPETNLKGACQIAERIRNSVANTYISVAEFKRIRITVSIGVTVFRRGEDVEQLLSRAGRLLEQAKIQGRNRVLSDLAA